VGGLVHGCFTVHRYIYNALDAPYQIISLTGSPIPFEIHSYSSGCML